jgi:hypothetical protein
VAKQQQQQQTDSQAHNGSAAVEAGDRGTGTVVIWFNPQNVTINIWVKQSSG